MRREKAFAIKQLREKRRDARFEDEIGRVVLIKRPISNASKPIGHFIKMTLPCGRTRVLALCQGLCGLKCGGCYAGFFT
jgi:hypothetical protein